MKTFKKFLEEAYTAIQGTQAGSNEGGIHTDENGKKFYIKYYKNGDQAKTEALTGKIYEHMGIHTVKPRYEMIDGKHAVVTEYNDDIRPSRPRDYDHLSPEQAKQLSVIKHGATLTKNWDIVGLSHDNLMKDKKGNFHAIDHGGSFEFRARGGHKDFDSGIGEDRSLVDNGEASGHVFQSVARQHPHAEREAISAVRAMDDDHIHHLFKTSGLDNWEDLHKNFMKRKEKLLARHGGE